MRIDINSQPQHPLSYNHIPPKDYHCINRLTSSIYNTLNNLIIHNVYVPKKYFDNRMNMITLVPVKKRVCIGLYSKTVYHYGDWYFKCNMCDLVTSNEFIYDTLKTTTKQYVIFANFCDKCMKEMECKEIEKLRFKYENYNMKFRKCINYHYRIYFDKQMYKMLSIKNII